MPVIDLMGGKVVRGIGGVRHSYRPIESRLCGCADPGEVAAALVSHFSFTDVYVADLDAIVERSPQVDCWRRIAASGMRLHLDAGLATLAACREAIAALGAENLASLIVGLETLERWSDLREVASELGDAATFSLDLRHGRPLRIVGGAISAEEIAENAIECGVRRMVLLDLAQVGQGRGTGTETLCRELASQYPGIEWITGGGVATRGEIAGQLAIGARRVLVSSALHQDEKILIAADE
ncbi:hypothetical protein LOC68_22565 [Blastopirellula sp. JC732]|uniref:HisA/hisF family protein n=1 Tax=Blastopirellula sediminis TaxID=2894196 RepID=A0A9X1MRN9_9BACT|nr:HisA/HisF-related TIM barrel protein [Blastopirellula sediminis]MCC9631185.1 hypothetical protein [Blastopirellula sediminis]